MESDFSLPNNAKYLILLKIIVNPSILLNLIPKGLESITILYEML